MPGDFDNLLWAYRAVFTQAGAGGGTIKVSITMNERMVFLYGSVGADDYAANRTVRGFLLDSAGNHIAQVIINSSLDNVTIPLFIPSRGTTQVPMNSDYNQRLVVGKGDVMVFDAASLIQNETLTVALRALFRSWPPTVTTTGSGGTVTVVTTYNEVI